LVNLRQKVSQARPNTNEKLVDYIRFFGTHRLSMVEKCGTNAVKAFDGFDYLFSLGQRVTDEKRHSLT